MNPFHHSCTRLSAVAVAVCQAALLLSGGVAFGETERRAELLARIDQAHQAPQQQKLKDLTAVAVVPSKAAALAGYSAQAQIRYAWKAPNLFRFEAVGLPRKAHVFSCDLHTLLRRQGHYLFPPTASQMAEGYDIGRYREGNLDKLTGVALDPKTELRRFIWWVAPDGRFVRRYYETRTQRELHTSFTYQPSKNGLLLTGFFRTTVPVPKKTEAQNDEPAVPAIPKSFWSHESEVRRVTLEYDTVEGRLIPVALVLAPVRGDKTPFALELTDFKFNLGVQAAYCKGCGAGRSWR